MASSSKRRRNHEVFLSFRNTDLRNSFLVHLNKALDQNGIYTFVASEELRKGDQPLSMLMKAIEESCIAVVVFSEDYASSRWCLEELAHIMHCKEHKSLTVFPVFYKVNPGEVRGVKESYGRALVKHESKFGKDSDKMKRWKKALFDAGNLWGWHLKDGDEAELIQRIVKTISTNLNRTPLHVAKHPVGIDSRVVKLKSMLNLDFEDDVVMVGLWGQGGIGKTTLVKALYNVVFKQFEGSCFLANVRETSRGCRGLVTLQEILLKDILLSQQRLAVSNVYRGAQIIQHRLGHIKVLLILDDVDDLRQVNALAGEGTWFGNGSRIIFTTRDKHLLTCQGIDEYHVYEVKPLDHSEAHELLSKHAFPTHQKREIKTNLVDSVLDHVKGLPLALEVLGSFLRGRKESEWESTLKKLSKIPEKAINDVLKISYDGLEENEREIFLHIVCFFKNKDCRYIKKVLDSCDFAATIGFEILMERSLINIDRGLLEVHDMIQLMGMDIVNQECCDDPRKRSRLWLYEDLLNVLSSDMGDCTVKAIVLEPPDLKEICIGGNAFTKMRRLRLLILHNVHNSFQGPICLPNELRWFEWPGCACQILEFSSGPKKLAGLDMSKSSITVVARQFKDFQNLKYINFSDCKSLVRMPDLSFIPNLEELDLHLCNNLVEAHDSIAYHDKLQVLNLRGCSKLCVLPPVLKSKNLRDLDLAECTKLERFPDIPHELEGLKEISLGETAIRELPTSIENLISLERIHLGNCKKLVSLPSSIYKLQNVKRMGLNDCTSLIRFPKYEDLADRHMKAGFPNLKSLDLWGCNLSEVEFLENLNCFPLLTSLHLTRNNITSLPTSISKRDHLSDLVVSDCRQLKEIPELPPFLEYLYAEGCESLKNYGDLTSVHDFVRRGLTVANISTIGQVRQVRPDYQILLPGGKMPEWVLPVEEGSVSFRASDNLYDKFLGFALCFVFSNDEQGNTEQKEELPFQIVPHVNGERRNYVGQIPDSLVSDHIQLEYMIPSYLWGIVHFGLIDESFVQFSLTVSGRMVKKWGLRIICKQLDDDLRAMLQDNQLMDTALLYEDVLESIDSESRSSLMQEGTLITDL